MIQKYPNLWSYHLINSFFRVIYSNDEKEDTIMKTIKKLEVLNVTDVKKQKVAAYARVSHRDLLQSLSEQISYYSKVIQDNPSWEYAGVYFDNSVSGRNTKNRKEYLRLIDDCRKGKINTRTKEIKHRCEI